MLSHTGKIADQTIRARSVAEDAIAEAQSVREEVEPRMVEILRRAELSASSTKGELTEQMK